MRARPGFTLPEQIVVLAIAGLCLAMLSVGSARLVNSAVVHGAARETAEMFAMARDRAMATGIRTAVRIDAQTGRVVVHADRDTLARLDLTASRAVRVQVTRDSMAYLPSGLGFGAANLRIILTRGAIQDTVTVSRLGRVRR